MTIDLAGAIIFFILTVVALIFALTRVSHIDAESFPNRGRFYAGLTSWILAAILAVFMSFPGYPEWFVPIVYPLLKAGFLLIFLTGFFMVLTTLVAFPVHMEYHRREIDGRSDRIALLENIRHIASQPYPVTELFTLVLKELGSFLGIAKGAIFLINAPRREMYLVASIGLAKDELGRLEHFPIGRDIVSQAAADQEVFVSGDLTTADSASRKLLLAGRDMTLSAAAVPLTARDRALGTLLVLSNKPYRFEKHDRMLLQAAAEAVAGVIETNRLARENQKVSRQLDRNTAQLRFLRDMMNRLAARKDNGRSLTFACRYLVEQYQVTAAFVISVADGDFRELARYESRPTDPHSESFRVAVIKAIRGKKTVVLNQEARDTNGAAYISRTVLVCPLAMSRSEGLALLLEAPGNALPLSDEFLRDLEGVLSLVVATVNSFSTAETGRMNQSVMASLLSILKMRHDEPREKMYRRFLDELHNLAGADSSSIVCTPDESGFHVVAGWPEPPDEVTRMVFQPGEGPIGKAMISGQVTEFVGRSQVEEAWDDLEAVNRDFLNCLFEEKGLPEYQLNIPIQALDNPVAVIVLFDHSPDAGPMMRRKGLLLLTAQLLSIKLSMADLTRPSKSLTLPYAPAETGRILNRINNDLATVIGRAQLLQQHSDTSGRTRYAAEEIIKAAEQVAGVVRGLQKGVAASADQIDDSAPDLNDRLNRFLQRRHVTGNLYLFDDNRAVMLQREFAQPSPFSPASESLFPFIEAVLHRFVTLLEEGDEVLLKSEIRGSHFYLSLVRGTREMQRRFDPTTRDFGDPDVLPRDIVSDEFLQALVENKGEVSFDRFGRRPTYLSFRFPCGQPDIKAPEAPAPPRIAGLKILAIDDQQMILDLLAGICQSLGLELTAVRDPARGLDLFRNQRFDMVMVDLAIGRVSGWDIARDIKQHSPDTPVIMLTGWGADIAREKAAQGNIDFTLSKPFRIEQLTEIISRAGSRHLSS